MRQHTSFFIATLLSFVTVAAASPVIYDVTVNTSAVSGTAGSLDFNFNPGPLVTQAASLQIINFKADGTPSGSPTLTGDVSGALPSALTVDNGAGFNDYFQGFTFGKTLVFKVSFFGSALSSPDGVSTSGSTFTFSMFSDAGGTIPALTNDTSNGFAFTVDVNLDGTTIVADSSSQTTVTQEATSPVPEPGGTVVLTGIAIALISSLIRSRSAGPSR